MTYSIVEAIGAIDQMVEQKPELGDRFVRESRRYWAAKKEVFEYRTKHIYVVKEFPYLYAFDDWDDYKLSYGTVVKETLLRENYLKNLNRETKDMIKWVSKKFNELDPNDNTFLPLLIVRQQH